MTPIPKPAPPLILGALTLCALASCGGPASDAPVGERLYASQGCAACHGQAGEGTMLGPPLSGLADHWSRETLIEHLSDPAGVKAKNPRLVELGRRYSMAMPAVSGLDEEQLGSLADWLLATMR